MKRSEWNELSKYLWKLSTMKSKHSAPIKEMIIIINEQLFTEDIKEIYTYDNEQTSPTDGNDTRLDTDSTDTSDR
tara:strand:- start:2366 stop:2590 length:225 start_codon:yes stop_codon:yes gene_type:complete